MITTKRVGGIRFMRIGRHQLSYCRCRAAAAPRHAMLRTAALVAASCAALAAFALLADSSRPVSAPALATPLALATPAQAAVPLPAPRPSGTLRDAVRAIYGARPSVRAAVTFDICAGEAAGARQEWLGPKRRRAYDRIVAKLDAAYAADPRDAAVHRVHRDFCRAAFAGLR